ncbi:MAG: hypothetical protein AAGA48_09420 [Myxococcota bacterium]
MSVWSGVLEPTLRDDGFLLPSFSALSDIHTSKVYQEEQQAQLAGHPFLFEVRASRVGDYGFCLACGYGDVSTSPLLFSVTNCL